MTKKRRTGSSKAYETSLSKRTATYDVPPPAAPALLEEWFEDDPLGEGDASDCLIRWLALTACATFMRTAGMREGDL